MLGSAFSVALMNLCEVLHPRSVYHMPKEEAYQWLKRETKCDFGYDALKWEAWGREHARFWPGWGGIAGMMKKEEGSEESDGGNENRENVPD